MGTELTCKTPSFENIGPKEGVEVFVSIKGADMTITSTFFTYYLNTKAENTIAYGPGVLGENVAGRDTAIIVQAKNKDKENRTSGNDSFIVKATRKDLKKRYLDQIEEIKEAEAAKKEAEKKGEKPKEEEGEEGAKEEKKELTIEDLVDNSDVPVTLED